MKKALLSFLLIFTLMLFAFAQKNLSPSFDKPEWQSVFGGDVVAPPKRTSYGFVSLTEGRLLSACTGSGAVLWRKTIKDIPSAWFTVSEENFIYLTSNRSKNLLLYSPDGIPLWEVDLPEAAIADPLIGADGRVFILSENSITCYGINGKRKWHIKMPKGRSLPLVEFNDGSLLYVPALTKDGASIGIRVSPYGELLEDIIFTGIISTICPYKDGLILGFEKGTVGCAAVIDGCTATIWSISSISADKAIPKTIIIGENSFCVLYSNFRLIEYSLENLSALWQLTDTALKTGKNFFAAFDAPRYVFASENYSAAYLMQDGKAVWQKRFNSQGGAFFPIVTRSAYLILSGTNWLISGYLLYDEPSGSVSDGEKQEHRRPLLYTSLQLPKNAKKISFDAGNFVPVNEALIAGDYRIDEISYKSFITAWIGKYKDEYGANESFFSNTIEKIQVLDLISKIETSDYNYLIPIMLANEKDPVIVRAILKTAGNIGYDPGGIMLQAVELLYSTKKTALAPNVLTELAETVFSICRYMGRPAFTKRGKALLAQMLLPQTPASVQNTVRNILLRFIDLEI